jgi:ribosomal protein L7/L12
MHPISLVFLGLCAFLLGFWLVRWFERRGLRAANASVPMTAWSKTAPVKPISESIVQNARLPQPHHRAVQDLLNQNRNVEAIKYLREHMGWSLSQAKTYVEQTIPTN